MNHRVGAIDGREIWEGLELVIHKIGARDGRNFGLGLGTAET